MPDPIPALRKFWKASAIIVAATIGEGMFALPYTFREAGWAVGLVYMVVLGAIVIVANLVYLAVLRREGEKKRLLGLAEKYFGRAGFWIGFVAIVAGLLLAFVAYLVLGPRFLVLAFPLLPSRIAFVLFWAAVSIPVLVSNRRAAKLEIVGGVLIAAVIVFVFLNGARDFSFASLPLVSPIATAQNLFLPFGIILLTFASWTGIEPLYEWTRGATRGAAKSADRGAIFGTIAVAVLYLLFIVGIAGAASTIAPDTISGILGWVLWKRLLVAGLGLFAVGVGSIPLTHEVRNALENDLGWHPAAARLTIIVLPAIAVLAGFDNFISILGLAGGCFVALEYLLIIAVGRRSLGDSFSSGKKFLLDAITAVFIIGAIYQIVSFVVK